MTAQRLYLPPDLEAAVRNRVLSLPEAWELFDSYLLTPEDSETMELPGDLYLVWQRLRLWQATLHGQRMQ